MVTVVVPVYQTEAYLDRCVKSILDQTYRDLEVLLIDDGSPDRCPILCDQWAGRDGRVRVIHQENRGVGMARNTGIAHARGEYLCFVDSDDQIHPEMVEAALSCALAEQADVVIWGMMDVGRSGRILARKIPRLPRNCYRGREIREEFLPELLGPNPKTGVSAQIFRNFGGCMISAALIRGCGWQIPSERELISEDSYALLDLFGFARTVAVVPRAFYGYSCENSGSLTHTYRADRFEKIKLLYHACVSLCRRRGYPAEVERRCADLMLDLTIGAMKQADRTHLGQILEDELLQILLKQKRKDRLPWQKGVLFWTMRRKKRLLCCLLLTAKKAVSGRA